MSLEGGREGERREGGEGGRRGMTGWQNNISTGMDITCLYTSF